VLRDEGVGSADGAPAVTHPHLPITHADLSRIVAETWPDVARLARVPSSLGVTAQPDGRLIVGWHPDYLTVLPRALPRLLDALELRYLVVDRAEGRVIGWAAVLCWNWDLSHAEMVRLVDLTSDERHRVAWDARVHAAIQDRMREEDGDAPAGKRELARAQGRAKARRAAR